MINLTVRIFVRAADPDFEEIDVCGKKSTPDFLAKDLADLTPPLEEEGLPKAPSGRAARSCSTSATSTVHRFDSTDPGERAMVDSAMSHSIGTFDPLLARATYPALRFGQYAGEAATAEVSDEPTEQARKDAETALAGPLETFNTFLPRLEIASVGGDEPLDRGHPLGGNASVPARDIELELPRPGQTSTSSADGGGARPA